jgi:hypothetical protein
MSNQPDQSPRLYKTQQQEPALLETAIVEFWSLREARLRHHAFEHAYHALAHHVGMKVDEAMIERLFERYADEL